MIVNGRGGVPYDDVAAVVLNVTVTGGSLASHLTVFPTGEAVPNASNLNFAAGQTIPNLVVAKVGDGGQVSIFNNAGAVHVIIDVAGWFPAGAAFTPLSPTRVLDTRSDGVTVDGQFAHLGAVGAGATIDVTVTGRGGVPPTDVGAVVLNVTATGATRDSHLRVFPTGEALPNASNVNFSAGQTIPNLVVAKVGAGGKVSIFNNAGTVAVIADVAGWFPTGDAYTPLSPARLADGRAGATTVDGSFAGTGPIGPGKFLSLRVDGRGGVPSSGAGAVVLNVTAVNPTQATHFTVFPTGATPPNASNLNIGAGQVIANAVIAKIGPYGDISIRNNTGNAFMIVDVVGWFPPGSTPDSYVDVPDLPAPLGVPAGDLRTQAEWLTTGVLAGGGSAMAALESALPKLGFPIVDGDTLVSTGFSGSGQAVSPWEVWQMAPESPSGGAYTPAHQNPISLRDFSESLASAIGAPSGGQLAATLVQSLRDGASGDPRTQFAAYFLSSLSAEVSQEDLLDPTVPIEDIYLHPVAAQLLARIVVNHLLVLAAHAEWTAPAQPVAATGHRSPKASPTAAPCQLTDVEDTIVSVAEGTITKLIGGQSLSGIDGFAKIPGLLDYLESAGLSSAKSVAEALAKTQVVLNVIQFLAVLTSLDIGLDMTPADPLVRTKSTNTPGAHRTLDATVRYDSAALQKLNCLRLVAASMGVTASFPTDGAITGAEVGWHGREGFWAYHGGQVWEQSIVIYPPLDVPTDKDGKASVHVAGKPQSFEIPDNYVLLDLQFSMMVSVKLKPANLYKDLLDAFSTATGGPVAGFVQVPMDLLLRSQLIANVFSEPFKDWWPPGCGPARVRPAASPQC